MGSKRFDWFFENHLGIGVRWDSLQFPLHVSVAIPFVTFTIGFGRYRSGIDENWQHTN